MVVAGANSDARRTPVCTWRGSTEVPPTANFRTMLEKHRLLLRGTWQANDLSTTSAPPHQLLERATPPRGAAMMVVQRAMKQAVQRAVGAGPVQPLSQAC